MASLFLRKNIPSVQPAPFALRSVPLTEIDKGKFVRARFSFLRFPLAELLRE